MKVRFLIVLLICAIFASCKTGLCAPTIAFIEVVDEESNVLENVSFSVSYNGVALEDAYVEVVTQSESDFGGKENIEELCLNESFVSGRYYYEIGSMTFSSLAGQNNFQNIRDKIVITVTKDGYEEQPYKISSDAAGICYHSLVLKKI